MWQSIHWISASFATLRRSAQEEKHLWEKVYWRLQTQMGPQRNVRPRNAFLSVPSIFLVSSFISASWRPSLLHLNIYQRRKWGTQTFLQRFQIILCVYQIAIFGHVMVQWRPKFFCKKWDDVWKIAGQLQYWTPQPISLPYDFSIEISVFLIKRLMRQANHLSSQMVRSRSALLECLDHIIACWILHLVCILFLNLPVRSNNMGNGHTKSLPFF